MLVGNCTCDIVKSKRIICRHLWGVKDHYGDEFQYTVDSFNKKLFIETHQLQIQSTTSDATNSTNNSNTSSNSNSSNSNSSNSNSSNSNSSNSSNFNCNSITNELNLEDSDPIPIPTTQSHKNKQSALTLLSTIKTIKSLIYNLQLESQSYTNFEQTGTASSIQSSLDQLGD